MLKFFPVLCGVFLLAICCSGQSSQDVPKVDGALGVCSVDITVNTADGKPVYAAHVKVHIAYGMGGFHKLDLEAGTNADGKVKITGLPSRVRRPPLEFEATKDELSGTATVDPAAQCHSVRTIKIENTKP
ncbi:MAG TPA: hypothetical protein VH088_03620 [Terriglobales bacterium]|jgi:hypothetical protein|nr:hypothetical protein [Terriglobales bacterium]